MEHHQARHHRRRRSRRRDRRRHREGDNDNRRGEHSAPPPRSRTPRSQSLSPHPVDSVSASDRPESVDALTRTPIDQQISRSRSPRRRSRERDASTAAVTTPRSRQRDSRSRSRPRGDCRRSPPRTDHQAPRRPHRQKRIAIPDNWADVATIGGRIGTSRFIAMRVPLDEKFRHLMRTKGDLWTPEIFLQEQADRGHAVGLVVDLTNTTKYYDGEREFRQRGVEYVKLQIEGFKHAPRQAEVDHFIQIVDGFVEDKQGDIAVHCTHGLNRTGYLIVSYLIIRAGMTVGDALEAFAVARPPGLIKHMYVEELYRRHAPNDTVVLPDLPAWAAAKYAKRR